MGVRPRMQVAINHGVLSEKGNGKDQAKSIPKPIKQIADGGGSTSLPSSMAHSSPALNPGEEKYTDQRAHFAQRRPLFASLLWRRVLTD